MKVLRLGTRSSQLALWQANHVAERLEKLGFSIEIVRISTTGDKLYNANLALIGGKGLFLKELEEAMLDGTIDFAVHSMKDVPAKVPDEFLVHSVMEREDPRDVFISFQYRNLKEVPSNSKIGTSSSRRSAFINKVRNDLECVPFRGNILTRLNKVQNNEVEGCVLAYAGLKRLKLDNHVQQIFDLDEFVPAVNQGILGVEFLKSNLKVSEILNLLKSETCELISNIERAFMTELEGNCTLPAALNAEVTENDFITLRAMYFSKKSNQLHSFKQHVEKSAAKEMASKIALDFKKL